MQLAIDTSTDIASLALVKDDQLIAELTWRCGQNHTIQLLPNLEYLLRQAKLDLRSVNGIIVARGPGSFNGLRVGLSTAKGLAFSLGIPVVAVSTLEAEAYQHAETGHQSARYSTPGGVRLLLPFTRQGPADGSSLFPSTSLPSRYYAHK
jgi:tRNA threonylcarbamoyl adenosine modification protein YeaZ